MGAELERWAGSCCFSRGRTEEEAGPTEGKSVSEGGSSSRFQEGRGGGRREREGGWRWVPRGRVLSATRREGRGDRSWEKARPAAEEGGVGGGGACLGGVTVLVTRLWWPPFALCPRGRERAGCLPALTPDAIAHRTWQVPSPDVPHPLSCP